MEAILSMATHRSRKKLSTCRDWGTLKPFWQEQALACFLSEGHFYHPGRLGLGSSDDEAGLHVLVRRDDFPVLDLLGDGADFTQEVGQGSAGTAGLRRFAGSCGCRVLRGCAFRSSRLPGCADGRLPFGGTRVTGKPGRKQNFACD